MVLHQRRAGSGPGGRYSDAPHYTARTSRLAKVEIV